MNVLRDAVSNAFGVESGGVWVYLVDLPARDMVVYSHTLPDTGDKVPGWMNCGRRIVSGCQGCATLTPK